MTAGSKRDGTEVANLLICTRSKKMVFAGSDEPRIPRFEAGEERAGGCGCRVSAV